MSGFFDFVLRPAFDEAVRGRNEVGEFAVAVLVKIGIARVFCPQLSSQEVRKTLPQPIRLFTSRASPIGFMPDKIPFPPRQHGLIALRAGPIAIETTEIFF